MILWKEKNRHRYKAYGEHRIFHNNILPNTFINEVSAFEEKMEKVTHSWCKVCRQRRIKMTVKGDTCIRCKSQKNRVLFCHENKTLPTWQKNGKVHYDVPNELSNLTIAEKMLIQRVSPLIPVIHIKNGMLGSKGHIVSFFQDIKGICNVLPRLPEQVSMVKVIRASVNRHGESMNNAFVINRRRVINALEWLKKHNQLYHDITIAESNLDWMNGKRRADLPNVLQCHDPVDSCKEKDR